jgi:hypothetical protein
LRLHAYALTFETLRGRRSRSSARGTAAHTHVGCSSSSRTRLLLPEVLEARGTQLVGGEGGGRGRGLRDDWGGTGGRMRPSELRRGGGHCLDARALQMRRLHSLNGEEALVFKLQLPVGSADVAAFANHFNTPLPPQRLADCFYKAGFSTITVAITCVRISIGTTKRAHSKSSGAAARGCT